MITAIQATVCGVGLGMALGTVMTMMYFKKPSNKMAFWIQAVGFAIFSLATVALFGSVVMGMRCL